MRWDTADGSRSKLVISRVNDIRRTQPFVPRFLPLGDERSIHELIADTVFIRLLINLLILVMQDEYWLCDAVYYKSIKIEIMISNFHHLH